MIGILLLLALGYHTPLFAVLYRYVPGFDRFRSMAKFVYPASLFIILLAAHGFDRLLGRRTIERSFLVSVFVLGGLLALMRRSRRVVYAVRCCVACDAASLSPSRERAVPGA